MRVLYTEDLEKMVTKLSLTSLFTEHICVVYNVLMEPRKFSIEGTCLLLLHMQQHFTILI